MYFCNFIFQDKIEHKFECNLLVSCSNHIILCQVNQQPLVFLYYSGDSIDDFISKVLIRGSVFGRRGVFNVWHLRGLRKGKFLGMMFLFVPMHKHNAHVQWKPIKLFKFFFIQRVGDGVTDPLYQGDWWPFRKRRSSCWVKKWTGRFLDFLVLP